ncbi:MAG: hypothetical protein AAB657_00545, partial [Patescibacteria group bacterium]
LFTTYLDTKLSHYLTRSLITKNPKPEIPAYRQAGEILNKSKILNSNVLNFFGFLSLGFI